MDTPVSNAGDHSEAILESQLVIKNFIGFVMLRRVYAIDITESIIHSIESL